MNIVLAMNMPFYGDPTSVNGASKGNRLLAEGLAARGHDVRCISPLLGPSSTLREPEVLDNIAALTEAPRPNESGWEYRLSGVAVSAVRRTYRLKAALDHELRGTPPDAVLVSCEDWAEGLLATALSAAPGKVFFLCLSPTYLPFGPHAFVRDGETLEMLERVRGIVAGSRYIERYIRQWSSFTPTTCYWPLWEKREYARLGGFDNEFVTFINPCAVKGGGIFLDIVRSLPGVAFAAVPTWGTTGEDLALLRTLENVTVLPPVDDIDVLMRRTRVLLMPSLFPEGLGATSLEAQLRAIPVLASNSGALPELVSDPDALIPVRGIESYQRRFDSRQIPIPDIPEQDAEPWIRALDRLTSDREWYEQKSKLARTVSRAFVEQTGVEPFEALLAEAAGSDTPPPELARSDEIDALLQSLDPEQSALLLQWLDETPDEPRDAIPVLSHATGAPLSFAQQRMWFMCQMAAEDAAYNIPWALRLRGDLGVTELERALQEIIRRHDSLRSRFVLSNGEPRAFADDAGAFSLDQLDLSAVPRERRENELARQMARLTAAPFDLTHGELVRATLFRLDAQNAVLLLVMHHIVCDGWSNGILNRELALLYAAFREGRPSPLPPLRIQYADFAAWQRQWLADGELERLTTYWRDHLSGLEQLRLEPSPPRPNATSHRAGQVYRRLDAGLRTGLERLCQQSGATLFMTLLACFQTVLHRYTGRNDIAVGTPIANRNRVETEPLIGLFVNSLVIRVAIDGADCFSDVLDRVRSAALGAYDHQDLPFERLVELLQPERDPARNPLFEILFAVQNAPMWAVGVPGLEIEPCAVAPPGARLDLELHAWEQDDGIGLVAIFSADMFDQPWIERMLSHFERVVRQAISSPSILVRDMVLVDDAERANLLDLGHAGKPAIRHRRIDEWIAEEARLHPDDVAVSSAGECLTYAELVEQAMALADHLGSLGVAAGDRIAIAMERRPHMLVAMLGTFMAGAAYVPLDPRYPAERLAFMMHDSMARIVLVHPDDPPPSFAAAEKTILVDITRHQGRPIAPPPQPADGLAYVIYTSGSTGQPKGVAVGHRGIVALAVWAGEVFDAAELHGIVASTSICFDVSVFELLTPLAHGGHVRIVPDALHLEMAGDGARMLSLVPSVAWQLARADRLPRSAHTVLLCGEVVTRALVDELRQRGVALIINAYGPTEDTVFSTWAEIGNADTGVPIGRPLPHSRAYIVDACHQLQSLGLPGELWLGGAGVAQGYHGRPELTLQRFVKDPFSGLPGHLYRSGDLARWNKDGQLEFLGRLDQQIKLRGFRVEPGEIEHLLLNHPAVSDCVVVPRDGYLIGYVVPKLAADGDAGFRAALLEVEHITAERTMWETVHMNAEPGDFASPGWKDSFDSAPIPTAEMHEWRDNILTILQERPVQRVLELGCGAGLLLADMAPLVGEYVATDISSTALDQVRHLVERHRLANVRLEQVAAHAFALPSGTRYDLVILNSVAQYFPSLSYLADVLARAIRATADGGRIVVADLRSLPLLEVFHRSLIEHRAGGDVPARRMAETVRRAAWREPELVIDPAWFGLLRTGRNRVGAVEVRLKGGCALNEITRFRYDVILHVGMPAVEEVANWYAWEGTEGLQARLGQRAPFGLLRVPNARLPLLQGAPAADPQAVIDLASAAGYRAELSWSRNDRHGHFDAAFRPQPTLATIIGEQPAAVVAMPLLRDPPAVVDWEGMASDPLRGPGNDLLMKELRGFLEARLPEFMVPAELIDVATLPRAPNGKLDREALAARFSGRTPGVGSGRKPASRTEKELVAIWQEILGVREIGLDDDFFRLGGHSLLVVRVLLRVRETFGFEVPLQELFLRRTVSRLAALVDEMARPVTPSLVDAHFDEGVL
jgi:amino acid adenylation domain-containing protein